MHTTLRPNGFDLSRGDRVLRFQPHLSGAPWMHRTKPDAAKLGTSSFVLYLATGYLKAKSVP
jgi:hypothetical protein